jgi:hypothetical protein
MRAADRNCFSSRISQGSILFLERRRQHRMLLRLVKQYGSPACDDACAAALELCVPEYRFVRRYLERNPQAPLSLSNTRQNWTVGHNVKVGFLTPFPLCTTGAKSASGHQSQRNRIGTNFPDPDFGTNSGPSFQLDNKRPTRSVRGPELPGKQIAETRIMR